MSMMMLFRAHCSNHICATKFVYMKTQSKKFGIQSLQRQEKTREWKVYSFSFSKDESLCVHIVCIIIETVWKTYGSRMV